MMRIALTFDDGPNTGATVDILDLLARYRIPASFFLVGRNITERTAFVIGREVEQGCTVECHSFSHQAFPPLRREEMLDEVERTNFLIEKYAGDSPRFFRPPYIALCPDMFSAIGLPFIAGRGVDDWDDSVGVAERAGGVTGNACDGQIILLHDQEHNWRTVEALERIVPALLEKGAEFHTVRSLFSACGVDPMRGHADQRIWTNVLD